MSKPRRFHRDVDGILLLDKPLGLSSNAALQQARALFGARKAGHAGSLDPLASGLLPVCFGQATKVCGRLLNSGKTYRVRRAAGRAHRVAGLRDRGHRARAGAAAGRRDRRCRAGGVSGRAAAGAADAFGAEVSRASGCTSWRVAANRSSAQPRTIVDSSHRARAALAADAAGVRRALLQGHLHPHAGRGHRGPPGHAGLCHGPAPPVGRSVRRPAHVHAGASWPSASPAAARRTCCCQPDTAFLDLPRVELDRGGRAGLLQGQDGRGAATGRGRASCGPTARRAVSGPGARGSRTGGSGRSRLFVDGRHGRAA